MAAGSVSVDVNGNFTPFVQGWQQVAGRLFTELIIPARISARTDAFERALTGSTGRAQRSLDTLNTRRGQQEMQRLGTVADTELRRIQQRAQLGLLGGGAAVFGGAAIIRGLSSFADEAAQLNDTVAFSEQVFGGAATSIANFAENADKSIGLSKQQATEFANIFGGMGRVANLAGADLSDFSIDFLKLAADMKAAKGGTLDEALTALTSGLAGTNPEPLRRYSIFLDELRLKEEARDLQLVKSTTGVLPANIRILAAQSLIMKDAVAITGQYAREYDSLPARQQRVQASLANLRTELGEGALPAFEGAVGTIEALVDAFSELPDSTQQLIGVGAVMTGIAAVTGGTVSALLSAVSLVRNYGKTSAAAAVENAALIPSSTGAATAIRAEGAAAAATSAQLKALTADYIAASSPGAVRGVVKPTFSRAQQAAAAADAKALTDAYVVNAQAVDELGDVTTRSMSRTRVAMSTTAQAGRALAGSVVPLGLAIGGLALVLPQIADLIGRLGDEFDETALQGEQLVDILTSGDWTEAGENLRNLTMPDLATQIDEAITKLAEWQNLIRLGFSGGPAGQLDDILGNPGEGMAERYQEAIDQIEAQAAQLPERLRRAHIENGLKEAFRDIVPDPTQIEGFGDAVNTALANILADEEAARIKADMDQVPPSLREWGDAAEDQIGPLERMARAAQDAIDPVLQAIEANTGVADAMAAIKERKATLEEIIRYDTDGIRSARSALAEAREALAEARADTGPFSEAADRAREQAENAEDRLLDIRREMAEALYDKQQREAKIAAGITDDLGPATFDVDYSERIARAQRDVDRANRETADIVAGRSDQVRNAQERVADAQARVNEEMAQAGPNSKAAADAQRDYERAIIDGFEAQQDQNTALAALADELRENPGLLAESEDAIREWAASIGLGADETERLVAALLGVGAAANAIPVPTNPLFGFFPPTGTTTRSTDPTSTTAARQGRTANAPGTQASVNGRRNAAITAAERAGETGRAFAIEQMTAEEFEQFERFLAGLTPRAFGGPIEPDRDYLVGERQAEVLRISRTGQAAIIPSVPQAIATATTRGGDGASVGGRNTDDSNTIAELQAMVAELRAMNTALLAAGRPNITTGPSAEEIRAEMDRHEQRTKWQIQASTPT